MPDALTCTVNGQHMGIVGTCITCRKDRIRCRYCGTDLMLSNTGLWVFLPHACKHAEIPAASLPHKATGFEGKTLKSVIQNWLYNPDMDIVVDASREMRRRFSKSWPRPDWLKVST